MREWTKPMIYDNDKDGNELGIIDIFFTFMTLLFVYVDHVHYHHEENVS